MEEEMKRILEPEKMLEEPERQPGVTAGFRQNP